MAVDPEALQRALRSQFPAPEVSPNSSDWMFELVSIFGSNPFVNRERDVLRLAEAPVSRLKAEPSEVRVGVVFEALNEIIHSQAFHFKIVLKIVAATLLRSGVELNSLEAVRLVELVSKPQLPFPFKAILSAIDCVPRTPALVTALYRLRGCVTRYHGEPEMKEIHERIDVLIGGPKEKPVTPAGAWSRIVFEEVATFEKKFDWHALLLHARSLTQSTASKKWQSKAVNLASRIGPAEVLDAARRWLALGPTPGEKMIQTSEAEADYQKGFIWVLGTLGDVSIAPDIADFAFGCFRKIPMIGAVSHRVGNACVNALAAMPGLAGVSQLSRLAGRVKYDVARRLIEKAMNEAAERNQVSRDDLEAMAVPTFGLDAAGGRIEQAGDCEARLAIGRDGASLTWSREGKTLKSVPASVKEEHAELLKDLNRSVKELDGQIAAQRFRLERQLISHGTCSYERWKQWYLDHPLVSHFAARLIWEFEDGGETRTAILWQGGLVDWSSHAIQPSLEARVRLWHPIRSDVQTILNWRCWLEDHQVRQPFKQAHREVYLLTDAERKTETYSNRFASHVIRQHQFVSLCRERGWKFKAMGSWDSHNTPSLELSQYNLVAKFDVEFPEAEDGDDESTTAHGVYLAIGTGRVEFVPLKVAEPNNAENGPFGIRLPRKFLGLRRAAALRLEEIPVLVFSEVMRDCDLFVGVTSIGADPAWNRDHADDPHSPYWQQFAFGDLNTASENRRTVLESLLPKLAIRDRCRLDGRFLVVRGDLHEYRIHIGSANVLIEPGSRYLCIVHGPGDTAANLPLPFEGDRILGLVLSKALLLMSDTKIKDPTIARQLS
ncbi:DUF4132 domain-containing protein [Acidicapsa acidisoli]|uniref:DUF4132 domain-containing protein n=1 Tax=Acidicapsa acidisoli TaxID=1615681 RepID=UPI0021E02875|nr:DUF4132 domain-containing protein [Acidicapsa acidisoli]